MMGLTWKEETRGWLQEPGVGLSEEPRVGPRSSELVWGALSWSKELRVGLRSPELVWGIPSWSEELRFRLSRKDNIIIIKKRATNSRMCQCNKDTRQLWQNEIYEHYMTVDRSKILEAEHLGQVQALGWEDLAVLECWSPIHFLIMLSEQFFIVRSSSTFSYK